MSDNPHKPPIQYNDGALYFLPDDHDYDYDYDYNYNYDYNYDRAQAEARYEYEAEYYNTSQSSIEREAVSCYSGITRDLRGRKPRSPISWTVSYSKKWTTRILRSWRKRNHGRKCKTLRSHRPKLSKAQAVARWQSDYYESLAIHYKWLNQLETME